MRRIAMMVMAGCVIGMLTGCGVPQEEHDAKVAELNTAWEKIETLKSEVADKESELKAEKANVLNGQLDLDAAKKSFEELTEKNAATTEALADEKGRVTALESDLAAAKSATGMAKDRISEVEAALAKLQSEYDHLQNRFDQLKKNMLSFGSGAAIPAEEPKAAAPEASASDTLPASETAAGLLDEMGMQ
jgi:SMC interacting uncharacterized protein involved in chromosome segregation